MKMETMTYLKYIGASDVQVNWGNCQDQRDVLKKGEIYEVENEEVHSYHTKVHLRGFPGRGFNSVCFEMP